MSVGGGPVVLDHVALAVPDIDEALDHLRGELGAVIISGDAVPGYRFAMLRVGDESSGMNLEVLEPWRSSEDNFLERFVQRRGAAPHHITFLQSDMTASLDALAERDVQLVRTKLNFGPWCESFIPPSQGLGSVIQLASSTVATPAMSDLLSAAEAGAEPPAVPHDERSSDRFWWADRHPPITRAQPPAMLESLLVRVLDLQLVREVFVSVLRGSVIAETATSLDLTWGASGRIRFEVSSEVGVVALHAQGIREDFSLGTAHFRRSI